MFDTLKKIIVVADQQLD